MLVATTLKTIVELFASYIGVPQRGNASAYAQNRRIR